MFLAPPPCTHKLSKISITITPCLNPSPADEAQPNSLPSPEADPQEDDTPVSRRLALTVLIGAAAVGSKVSPADAAYGEAANVFGKPHTNTDFLPYDGKGFKLLLPSKWNPIKELEYPGQILRYVDNFDSTTNVTVMASPTDKKSFTDYGSPENFLSTVDFLQGKQAYSGKTVSEGGFEQDEVATANSPLVCVDKDCRWNGRRKTPTYYGHSFRW